MASPEDDLKRSVFSLVIIPPHIRGISPYRLTKDGNQEIEPANEFLDMLATRGLSERTLRTYGYCLLNLWQWLSQGSIDLNALTETALLEYIRFQYCQGAEPKTINLRLTVVRSLYCFLMGREMPRGQRTTRRTQVRKKPPPDIAHLRPTRQQAPRLRVKAPHRVVVPLTPEEVNDFFSGFRSWRDLSIVGFMLLCGLRSREVISLLSDDVRLSEEEFRVRGKGNRDRIVPLPPQLIAAIQSYLQVERPRTTAAELFVSLKGVKRGRPMTVSGLRSLFRYHRRTSHVLVANAHRLRHTFGAEMVRAGISLPVLMKLMGHSTIQLTMLYVQVSAADVRREYNRVVEKLRSQKFRLQGDENG
jgi:site-specific recombinase XerD